MRTGNPAHATVAVSDAMLKTTRCSGLRPPARIVHCAHALAVAMTTVAAGPSANSDQKFTACDSERVDSLRPSGRSIFAADVATPIASSTVNSTGCVSGSCIAATARQPAPAATTTATYARAASGSERNAGTPDAALIPLSR